MKVVETIEKYGEEGDSRLTIEIFCENGDKQSVSFGEGEPEDMYLFRDLSDVYSLFDLVKKSYEAGKRGEPFEFEEIIKE